MTNLNREAQQLAKAGWPVFPVHPTTKRPMTRHGHLDATTDTMIISLSWQPLWVQGASIATPTGDGLLVIDVDPRNGGKPPHWVPKTLSVRTQSGGLHFYLAIDEDIKSRAGLFGPGVDSKCKGGYVLVPPSPGYEWINTEPKAGVTRAWIERYFNPEVVRRGTTNTRRLPPNEWRRGIIHDQVVAWAAYWASELDDEREVVQATWLMVQRARDAGTPIDNARGHIDTAIQWVLERERDKQQLGGPSLG